ncbi:MAG: AMIN domain-containing protein, partial [Comamonas sp.]
MKHNDITRGGAQGWRRLAAAFALGGIFWLGAALALLVAPASAAAQVLLRQASVVGQGGHDVVRLDFSQPLAEDPVGFVLHTPARIVLDLPGVANGLDRHAAAPAYGNVSGVSASEATGRTRVVLSLKRATPYRLQRDGQALFVILGAPAQAEGDDLAPTGPLASLAPLTRSGAGDSRPFIGHVDFRRGEGGSGRVIVELPSDQISVDVRPQ